MKITSLSVLKGFWWISLVLVLAISLVGFVQPGIAQVSDPPPDQVAVKLRPSAVIGTILARYNATLLATLPETRLYILRLPAGQTANALLPTLNADADLFYAEPNYYAESAPNGGVIYFGADMAPQGGVIYFGADGDLTPTPPSGPDQWAWTKIGLLDAQKISRGQGIVVAVLDTGLAADHPLLNSSLTAGYDFVGMSNSIYDTGNGLDDDGDGLVDEDLGHGTHVSGIIVTEAPGVQIMPIRVLNSDGVGTYWEVAAGIRYAVDHGAKIVNMSMSAPRLPPSLASALAYASAHGVIVVGAAGSGSGPNYPAAFADQLAVLGVGATDRDDRMAWFSGGQAVDTDVFAPGVDIHSAFPYNGYAMGSGTSMAAPMVSAEAALLWARHPDWSTIEVAQRILTRTAPVSGSSVGRIDLAAALSTGLEIDHASPDFTSAPGDEYVLPRLRLFNNTPQDIPLSELTIRYWYTLGPLQPQTFHCDYATPVACSGVTGAFIPIAPYTPNRTSLSDTYLEVGFAASAGNLPGGGQVEMYLRFFRTDLIYLNETNDYSYDDPARPDMTRLNRITVYRNGSLVWGVEPGNGILTPTPTFLKTRTATNTAVTVSPTRTSTSTASAAGPTRTPTRSLTPTRTPITPTRSSTPTRTWTGTNTSTPSRTSTRSNTPTGTGASITPAFTNTPTRSKTPTAAAATSCSVNYVNQNDWGSGFTANVVITNNGPAAITGWTIVWAFPGNQVITSLWNGAYIQTGPSVSVTNVYYNDTIGPNGGTVTFGFNANYSGPNAKPASFQLNGAACSVP